MSRIAVLAAGAVIPFVSLGLLVADVLDLVEDETVFEAFKAFGHPVAMVFLIGVLVLYIIDIWRNPHVPEGKRWLWTAVVFLGNLYALPFYFWFYVRPKT